MERPLERAVASSRGTVVSIQKSYQYLELEPVSEAMWFCVNYVELPDVC